MNFNVIKSDMNEIFCHHVNYNNLKNQTVVLTGAYGMLASYITYFLMFLNKEHSYNMKIVVMVRNGEKFYNLFRTCEYFNEKDIKVIEYDFSSLFSFDCGDIKADYIIHTVSFASPNYYAVKPVEVLMPNIFGTRFLLDFAYRSKCKGFLLFSSGDVYGDFSSRADVKDGALVSENLYGSMDPLDIHSCYSESKRMAETMCYSFYKEYGVQIKIARIAHTYSPTMNIDSDPRVFSSFVKNIIEKKNIVMHSDGKSKRCFTYITDAVAAYFKILLEGNSGEAYNVCNTEEFYSIRELAEMLVGLYPEYKLGVEYKQRSSSESYTENNLQSVKSFVTDSSKLKELGFVFNVSVRDGFKRVIRYLNE